MGFLGHLLQTWVCTSALAYCAGGGHPDLPDRRYLHFWARWLFDVPEEKRIALMAQSRELTRFVFTGETYRSVLMLSSARDDTRPSREQRTDLLSSGIRRQIAFEFACSPGDWVARVGFLANPEHGRFTDTLE